MRFTNVFLDKMCLIRHLNLSQQRLMLAWHLLKHWRVCSIGFCLPSCWVRPVGTANGAACRYLNDSATVPTSSLLATCAFLKPTGCCATSIVNATSALLRSGCHTGLANYMASLPTLCHSAGGLPAMLAQPA